MSERRERYLDAALYRELERQIERADTVEQLRAILQRLPIKEDNDAHMLADSCLARAVYLLARGDIHAEELATGLVSDYDSISKWYA